MKAWGLAVGVLVLTTACSGASPSARTSDGSAMASCTALLTIDGKLWTAVSAGERLRRSTGPALVQATQATCDDVGSPGEPMDEPVITDVTLTTIEGVSPEHGLFWDADGWEDQVWVPAEPVFAQGDLPADVQALIDEH